MLDQSALMLKHYGTDDPEKIKKLTEEDSDIGCKMPAEGLIKMPLPYYAPDSSLPPIPTAEDVENAQTPENVARARATINTSTLYRVNGAYAVKFSTFPNVLQEAENLLFLQEHDVRSPKVYAVFSQLGADPVSLWTRRKRPVPTYYYLVMEFIDGIALDDSMFSRLAPEARIKIYDKIGEQVRLLRSIPPPNPSYYGRIKYQGYYPFHTMLENRYRSLVGPFSSYEAFLEHLYNGFELALIRRLLKGRSIDPEHQLLASNFYECFGKSSESGDPKLTHMDLKLANMMLVPSTSNPSDKLEDYDLWLLDWEELSWMPAWAEAASLMSRLPSFEVEDEKARLPEWRVSSGLKPFYYAQAYFWHECNRAFGGFLI